jgi:hypothetical protein
MFHGGSNKKSSPTKDVMRPESGHPWLAVIVILLIYR